MQFVDFAKAHGILINDLYPSDRIHRCGTVNKPKSKNGAWFWDGDRGWVFDWSGDATVLWYGENKPWTDEDKAAWKQKRQAANAKVDDLQRKTADRAAEMLNKCKPGEHNYFHYKGFPKETGLILDSALAIPMRDFVTNDLLGLQFITWNEETRHYDKKMMYGMKAKGAVFKLGSRTAQETYFVEGLATGLSVEHALRSIGIHGLVIVCFSAGNLEYVAQRMKGKKFIFADNDASGTGEKVSIATGLPYCMSDTVGQDANDLHISEGLMSVCQKIMKLRNTVTNA